LTIRSNSADPIDVTNVSDQSWWMQLWRLSSIIGISAAF
jgi:hypothetical protein